MPQEITATQVIERALESNRMPHALLMHGDDLDTLTQTVLPLVGKLLGCSGEKVLKHSDCFTLRPANKMRQISVDATRQIIKDIQHSPLQASKKVGIIFEVDRMHRAAANAFLKTLEEPPADTVLFLLTTRPHALLDTIRSRCFQFRIPSHANPVDDDEWQMWLAAYGEWIERVHGKPKNKKDSASLVLGTYRLVSKFGEILEKLSDIAWEADKPEGHMADEEEVALKTGSYKQLRSRLLREIQIETRNTALGKLSPIPGHALGEVTRQLERVAGLLEVNLNESAALEHFMLTSLRSWASA